MKLSISPVKALQLHAMLNNMAVLAPVITIVSTVESLKMQGMDCCQVCLFDCWFCPSWFDEYVSGETECKHVSSKVLATILKMVSRDQTVTLELSDDNLVINFFGGDISCNKAFQLPLMETDYEPIDISQLMEEETTAELCMTSKKFSDLVSQFELFDEVLTFELTESTVKMSATGEAGSMSAALDVDEGHLLEYEIVEEGNLKQSFSHRFVKSMASFSTLSGECELLFFEGRPMFMVYKMVDEGDVEKVVRAKLIVMLAPRVE